MKILAMYLPQFHRVQENDEWWGEGFTEWTSVRSAKPLFPEHDQPHAPLHENYYDLMNPETMRWQADLMHHYGVDGMCFYHYYFKDGRRILERPAENLLHWKDIDMPFCFSWANEAWIRSWSRLTGSEGNAWASKFDQSQGKEFELFRILPRLRRGVRIHFHDIFYPFTYPEPWVRQGRPYTEAYALRALLTRSDAYEMLYFSDMMIHLDYTDAIKMRERYKNYGTGSFWMRKR